MNKRKQYKKIQTKNEKFCKRIFAA